MEKWDLYDNAFNKTGKTIFRGEKIEEGYNHLVVHVLLFNENGEMLIQHRVPLKELWPNLWDFSVGGSALCGENSMEAAMRETYEEIGYKVDLINVYPDIRIKKLDVFDDTYMIKTDVNIMNLKLQKEEVDSVSWASCDEILSLIDDKKFIPFSKSYIEYLFHLYKYRNDKKL